jgi:hypothetical protein
LALKPVPLMLSDSAQAYAVDQQRSARVHLRKGRPARGTKRVGVRDDQFRQPPRSASPVPPKPLLSAVSAMPTGAGLANRGRPGHHRRDQQIAQTRAVGHGDRLGGPRAQLEIPAEHGRGGQPAVQYPHRDVARKGPRAARVTASRSLWSPTGWRWGPN